MAYEMKNRIDISSSISFVIDITGWIIVGNYKRTKRAFKVNKISGHMYLNRPNESLTAAPGISIQGQWSNSSGHKWSDRSYYWNWQNTNITFDGLPSSIKENIYTMVETQSREFLLKLHNEYKELTAYRGFTAVGNDSEDDMTEEDGESVFRPTIQAVGPCIYENMDVSEWPVARKELGLPKPPRKPRKKKVII